ncbi:choice-of-anchor Q domain-containing protein [Haloferula sp.]|uniref:choice-of-anchor Q domain-containing protein n=1 Tax=Haloferula sp. TaxID=2497595 RepID=UPI003C77B77D
MPASGGIVQIGAGQDFTIAAQQSGSATNTEEIPDVTGGSAGVLIPYTEGGGNAYSSNGGRDGANGIGNLNDGDVGIGNVTDGTHAKPSYGKGTVVMDLGGPKTISSIAIYHGYASSELSSFELKDGLGNRIGRWYDPDIGSSTNAYWLVFDQPVTTDRLVLDTSYSGNNPGTPSFREIQVFSLPVTPPLNEVSVFGTDERTGLSNDATGDLVKLERHSGLATEFNGESRITKDVSIISGGEIVIEDVANNDVYEFNDDLDVKSMEIMAETVIIRSPLHLRGTHLTIHAHNLRFEGAGKIITSPADKPLPGETLESTNGLPAGSVEVFVDVFTDVSGNNSPKFDLTGGKGQDARKGAHGTLGTSLAWRSQGPFEFSTYDDDASYTPPAGWWVTRWKGPDGDILNGVEAWPTSGGDAAAPGQPGDGGNAGVLTSSHGAISGVYEAGQAGAPGTPDSAGWTSETGYCRGGVRGFPDQAIHIYAWTSGAFDQTAHISEDGRSETFNGRNEAMRYGNAGAVGSRISQGNEFSWVHPQLLRQVLAGIKDDYLQNRITDAEAALAGYSTLIENYRTASIWSPQLSDYVHPWDDAPPMTRYELNQIYDEMQILRQQIVGGLDYFGNPNGWVPMLSFEFTKNLFDQEIDRSLDIIYLSRWISRMQDDASVMYAALDTASTKLKVEIDQAKIDYDVAEATLLNLTGEGQTIRTSINNLQQQLQLRDNTLRQDAKENVAPSDWEVGLRVGLKVAGTMCEMIPVYQPALGGAGRALNLGANIGSEQPWETVTGGYDITSAYANSAIAATAAAQKTNKNAVDTGDLGAERRLERLEALGQASSGLSNGIKSVSSALNVTKVPASEVAAELSKLRKADPDYKALVDEVEKMLEKKRVWADALNNAIRNVARLSDTITRNILAVDSMDVAASQQGNIIDSRINSYMKDMERRAFDRLLKYHYYMAKAFEYRLVRPYSGTLDLQPLFDQIESIASAGKPGGTLDAGQRELLKSAYRVIIAETTENIVTQYSSSPSDPVGTRSYTMTADQLETLNQGEKLKLNLYELPGLFPPHEENVRIIDLEVIRTLGGSAAPGMITTPRSGGSYNSSTAYVELSMEHSGVSNIKLDGNVYQFRHYNESTRNAITWKSQYEPNLNEISPTPLEEASDSLLRSLIANDSNAILFSRPSAWADLNIWRSGANGAELFGLGTTDPPIVITNVTLRVSFDRVTRTDNPNVRDVSVVAQSTDGTPISPRFQVSEADRNDRLDGEGRFLRIYNFGSGSVEVTAPPIFSSLGFVKWMENDIVLTTSPTATVSKLRDFRLVAIYSPMAPVISALPPETAPYLEFFAYKVRADFAAQTYAATGLPPGLSIDSTTGIISGTATALGTYTVNLTATNALGSGTGVFTLSVADLRQMITSTANSGAGSVRDLVAASTPGRVLIFDASLDGQTIDLSGSHLMITDDLTIDASSLPNGVTISAGGNSRHFMVTGGKTLTLNGVTLTDGSATGDYPDYFGGSIYSEGGNVNLIGSTISGCYAWAGGAIFIRNGILTAVDSTISGNSNLAGGIPATIYAGSNASIFFRSCTVSGNTEGYAILSQGNDTEIINCSVVENTGDGINLSGGASLIRSTTVANNTGQGIRGTAGILENCLISGNMGSAGLADVELGVNIRSAISSLSPLGNYGGKTQTMRPLSGNPAIDGGQATATTPAADQRGYAAFQGLDIGAFQTQLGTVSPVDINQDLSTGDLAFVVGTVGNLTATSSNQTLVPDGNITFGGSGSNRTVAATPVAGESGDTTITITDDLTGGSFSFPLHVGSTAPLVTASYQQDGTPGSLRDVVARVAEGSTITFTYRDQSDLTRPILIDKDLTIDGILPFSYRTTLASNGSSRLFEVAEGVTLTIKDMDLSGGSETDNEGGGAILNRGTLTLINSQVLGCATTSQGGGIRSLGDLTLVRCVIGNNTAAGSGGGVFHTGGKLSVTNSTIGQNTSSAQGGGIYCSGETDLIHNTISANTSLQVGGVRLGGTQPIYIENTIVADNHVTSSAPDLSNPENALLVSGGGNLIGNNLSVEIVFPPGTPNAGNDYVNMAAKLTPLTTYSGKLTMIPLPGSPAYEHGVVTALSPTDDTNGKRRPIGYDTDIGAYEGRPIFLGAWPDSDSDGIPDLFEGTYSKMTVGVDDSLLDSDGDGWLDIDELRGMTDPEDGSSFLKILSVVPDESFPSRRWLHITIQSFPSLQYQVEGSADLSSWADIPNEIIYSGGLTTTHRVVMPENINYIRVRQR